MRHVESICHKDYESLKKSQPSCLKFLEAKRGEGFTCAHGGGNDCKRHMESICHKDYESLKKSQPSCLKFLEAKRGEGQQDIIKAEAMMCDLLVEHDLPFSAADMFTKAVKYTFPDSKIARSKQQFYDSLCLSVSPHDIKARPRPTCFFQSCWCAVIFQHSSF